MNTLQLLHGTSEQRNNWCLIGKREGIHWSDLDGDISVENVLLGGKVNKAAFWERGYGS